MKTEPTSPGALMEAMNRGWRSQARRQQEQARMAQEGAAKWLPAITVRPEGGVITYEGPNRRFAPFKLNAGRSPAARESP